MLLSKTILNVATVVGGCLSYDQTRWVKNDTREKCNSSLRIRALRVGSTYATRRVGNHDVTTASVFSASVHDGCVSGSIRTPHPKLRRTKGDNR